MMGAFIVLGIMIAVFFVFGVLLTMGKASFLIAGYNTSTSEEKKRYDERKLCRSTGRICFMVVLMLILITILGYRVDRGMMTEGAMLPYALASVGVILGAVIIEIFYANTKCIKK